MTNIKGLFAAGECDFSQHGGNRLGANSLLSAIYGGTSRSVYEVSISSRYLIAFGPATVPP
jgi:aspartate oxidase